MKDSEPDLMYDGKKVLTFTYKGDNSMLGKTISLDDPIPRVNPKFEAKLNLSDGSIVDAPQKWRRAIWRWWFTEYRESVFMGALKQAAKQMTRG